MPKKKKSTYFFIAYLSDPLAMYFISNLKLADGYVLEVIKDCVAIWGSTYKNFDQLRIYVSNTLDIITSAVSYLIDEPIFYTLKNWVETQKIIAKENMIGAVLLSPNLVKHYPIHSKKNKPWKKSAFLYNLLYKGYGNSNHVIALKDYRIALSDKTENAYLFAYRAVEDICRAVTGCDDPSDHWDQMHIKLGTSKKFLDPLIKIAKKVRHGNLKHLVVQKAKKKRHNIINISRVVIEKELRRTFPGFL